ncbi:hypothetical protein RHSIM_Rhsim01G0035200 [Rhododendron simsii]|uniref:Uncharacterized protein n=1 Tax=Rhododendron simsii TaxID=118357 RepID=A0A834HRI2_RHOSS|nr:hypothetical protein RHSIM_Rhsim01G0035200 [Rhododendron simsii]
MTNPYYEEAMSRKMAAVERERWEREHRERQKAYWAHWDKVEEERKCRVFEEPVGPPFPDEVDQAYPRYGGVFGMDMRKEKWWVDYDMCAKLAVHKYNSYFKGTSLGELEFIKTLKVSSQIAAGMVFIVTFEAKHLTAVGASVQANFMRNVSGTKRGSLLVTEDFHSQVVYGSCDDMLDAISRECVL